MTAAIREHFHTELRRVQDETCVLGTMVATAITESVGQLCRRDRAGSERLVAWDERVNEKCHAIETSVLALIATQAPVAGDMRLLAGVLDTIGELERIGDYAKGIARINLKLDDEPYPQAVLDILVEMSVRGRDMLDRGLSAFTHRDPAMARAILREDDAIDALFREVFRLAMTSDGAAVVPPNGASAPRRLERVNYLMWAAHNLERSADRVTNICQRVIFTATGDVRDLDRE